MDAQLLQKVNLRKVGVVNDSSGPKLSGFISDTDVADYQDSVIDINMEYWIDILGDLTFPTQFYTLTEEDAQLFIDCYAEFEEHKSISASLQGRLSSLEAGLQGVIEAVKGTDKGVFVKTSSRSAKDTGVYLVKFRDLYKHYLSMKPQREDNDKIISLLEAGTYVQMMEDAHQVMQMFSISERISQDMKLALARVGRFKEHFVVRQWIDLDPSMEFRGFVNNNKLNALSQYNHLAYFPRVCEQQAKIVQAITTYFDEKALPRLRSKFSKYIIDFALLPNGDDDYTIWVIELNPFLETTDGCLFSWQKERQLLEDGPFEFRCRSGKVGGARSMLANAWRDVISDPSLNEV